jgi:hypothetical protein
MRAPWSNVYSTPDMKPFREGYIQFRSIRKMTGLVKVIKYNNYMEMYRTMCYSALV